MSAATGVDLAFWFFSAVAVWSGWRVFRVDSMVRATFSLLLSFVNVAAIMLLLAAEYLATAILFMMTVEMVVMAVFMVAFMMNPAGLNPMMMVHQHRLSIAAGVAAFATVAVLALATPLPLRPLIAVDDVVRALGLELMGGSMLVMQGIGVTLLATIVSVTVLSSMRGRHGDAYSGSRPPVLDPEATGQEEDAGAQDAAMAGHGEHGGDHGGHGGQG